MNLPRSLPDPTVPSSTRLLRLLLVVLLLAGCAYRVWLILKFNPVDYLSSDPGRHWSEGTRPMDLLPMSAVDPVAYQIYLGTLAHLTARQGALVAYWTALLSLAGPWLWYRFLRELLPTRDWALAGWVVLTWLPSWSAIYSYFMQETLMLPLLGLALWATWRCRRKGGTANFVVAVAAWLAAGLTRGICLPLGAVAMTWVWFEQRGKWPKAVAAILLVIAVMGPLAGRSWTLARVFSPHGIGYVAQIYALSGAKVMEVKFTRGANYWTYVFISPTVQEEPPLAPLSEWRTRREGVIRISIDLDAGRYDWREAMDRLPPLDLQRLAWLTGDNLVNLFFGVSWPDTNRERLIGELNYWSRWLWAPLTIGCLILMCASWRRQRERLLPSLILTWFVVQGLYPLSVNEGRYRKPFEGLLVSQCLLVLATSKRTMGRRQAQLHAAGSPSGVLVG